MRGVGAGLDPHQSARRLIKRARRDAARLIQHIEAALRNGDRHRARGLQKTYLASFYPRLKAVADANCKLRRPHRLPLSALPEVAARLDAWRGTDETVRVSWVAKRSGGQRPTMGFGLENKALQILARDALLPFAELRSFQYAVSNGGVNALVKDVLETIPHGYKWAVELDVKDCFASLDAEAIKECLPLPGKVTEAVLVSKHLNLIHNRKGNRLSLTRSLVDSRRGLPQGSAASPLVAEMLLADILTSLPTGARVFAYADNVLVLARTKAEAALVMETLQSAFWQSPVGKLRLECRSDMRRVCDGFDFLGYRIRRRKGGAPRAMPTSENCRRLASRCWDLFAGLERGRSSVRHLRSVLRGWVGNFRCCERPDIIVMLVLGALAWFHFPDLKLVARREWEALIRKARSRSRVTSSG